MIDIVFSESACGSLKVAQHFGEGKFIGECTGVIMNHGDGRKATKEEIEAVQRKVEEKDRLAWESATPLGGNPADVYGFNLMLSVGDISEDQPGVRRRQVLEHSYSVYPNDEGCQIAQEILQRVNETLKTVRERATGGESIRIWYSNQPDEMCGLYWFMEQLNQWKVNCGQIFMVKLPEWEANKDGNIVRKNSWGEVAAEEWQRYLSMQKPIPPVFLGSCASRWRTLQKENAPLRAVLNGQLVSMPETLYDDFIIREIAVQDETFQEALLVGRVLGKYQLGIGDFWVALRIEEMINTGKVEAVTAAAEDEPIYHRLLKKSAGD